MSLRDIDPDGVVRHEDLKGLISIEILYQEKAERDAGKASAASRRASRRH